MTGKMDKESRVVFCFFKKKFLIKKEWKDRCVGMRPGEKIKRKNNVKIVLRKKKIRQI